MAILELDNPLFNTVVAQYYADMTALADMAYAGEIDEFEYRTEQERITTAVLLALFLLAGGNQGTPAEARFLAEQQAIIRDSANALATDLFDGRYSASETVTAEEARASLLSRLELWTFNMGQIWHMGLLLTPVIAGLLEEPRKIWRWGDTVKHCRHCGPLDGVVLTDSEWIALNIWPQSSMLECGGYRCGCGLYSTDLPSIGLENVLI